MALRFFADHCVPQTVVQTLRDAGHEVFILKEQLPRDSDDAVVIARAQELGAILVSLNGDFADITAYPPSRYQGIIALRLRNRPQVLPALMGRLMAYVSAHPEMPAYEGRLFLIEARGIRIRK